MATRFEETTDHCSLVTESIDLKALAERARTDESGAVALFTGTVRNHHEGRQVESLQYEAYGPMAERQLKKIAIEVRSRWSLEGVAIIHRTGHLKIGETSVAVAVAAAHRKEALAACSYALDRLKESVPIWNKEFGEAGAGWLVGASGNRAGLPPQLPLGPPSARRRDQRGKI